MATAVADVASLSPFPPPPPPPPYEIVDEAAYNRFCARMRLLYGHLPPDDYASYSFQELARIGEDVYGDGTNGAIARIRYILRRMDEDWKAYVARTVKTAILETVR